MNFNCEAEAHKAIYKVRLQECGRKYKYKTVEDAEAAIVKGIDTGIGFMGWYQCRFCTYYHVGHKLDEDAQAKRNKILKEARAWLAKNQKTTLPSPTKR